MINLGQHFLKNKAKIKKIVEALNLENGDTVIEIGPGHGELTEKIIERLKDLKIERFKIITIEKDRELAEDLRSKIHDLELDKNVEIFEGDALKEIKNQILKIKIANQKSKIIENLKIVGNIPYYITGYLLRILGDSEIKPSLIVLLIQKEVAERICALRQAQGKPKMNLLAASVQFWAEPKIIGYISKKYFRPAPKVDSAIIKLTTNNQQPTTEEAINYYRFIKILFKQPRKTIQNNLKPITKNLELITNNLKLLNINPQARPQDLNLEQIMKLSQMVKL